MKKNAQPPANQSDRVEYAELFKRFEPLIKSEVSECVKKLPSGSEFDREELESEAMMALYKAYQSYRAGKNVTFGLYAKICIHNKLISCSRKINSKRRKRQREEERRALSATHDASAEESFMSQLRGKSVEAVIEKECSRLEKKIFSLYLEKKSYAEIAGIVGRDVRSVGNAVYRVKRKLRERLSDKGE